MRACTSIQAIDVCVVAGKLIVQIKIIRFVLYRYYTVCGGFIVFRQKPARTDCRPNLCRTDLFFYPRITSKLTADSSVGILFAIWFQKPELPPANRITKLNVNTSIEK